MTLNDIKWWKQKKKKRWASGCLEQSGREGLNSKAIEKWWKDLLLLLKATPISQGHLINRQQLSPFQMVIFFLLNASFSMPYCLLQQTLVGFFFFSFLERGFSCFIYYIIYCWSLCRHFSLTSSMYNGELVVNGKVRISTCFSSLTQHRIFNELLSRRFNQV